MGTTMAGRGSLVRHPPPMTTPTRCRPGPDRPFLPPPPLADQVIAEQTNASTGTRSRLIRRVVEAAVASSRGGFSNLGKVDAEKVAVREAALAVAASDSAERARLLAVLAGELSWHPDHARRIALANEAVAVARRTGDPATLVLA